MVNLLFILLGLPAFSATLPTQMEGLDLISNKTVSVDLTKSTKATVIVFLSSKCPCSSSHEETLATLQKEYESKGFKFIGVHSNTDEDVKMSEEHFTKSHFKFPVIQDDKAKLADIFAASKTPHVYVVNNKNEILYQGGVDDSHDSSRAQKPYLREALAAIAQNQSPPAKETRTLGCMILR